MWMLKALSFSYLLRMSLMMDGCDTILPDMGSQNSTDLVSPAEDFAVRDCQASSLITSFNDKYKGIASIVKTACDDKRIAFLIYEPTSQAHFVCLGDSVLTYNTCQKIDGPLVFKTMNAKLFTLTDSGILLIYNIETVVSPQYCNDYGTTSYYWDTLPKEKPTSLGTGIFGKIPTTPENWFVFAVNYQNDDSVLVTYCDCTSLKMPISLCAATTKTKSLPVSGLH